MIQFPGDALRGYPSTQSPGALLPSVGGAERFNMINANKIVVFDIDAGTASIKDATISTAKIGLLQVTEATIAALAVTEAKIGNLAVTNAKINDLSAAKINAGTLLVGGAGNAVQFQANNSSGGTILQINNDGVVFANDGSPGLFFNNPGGASRTTIFNDGSGNMTIRAGSSNNIYFQRGDGDNNTLIINTEGRVVQIGDSDHPSTLYCVPRSAAPGSPTRGMIYYDSDDDKLYCHNGTGWQALF